MLEKVYNSANSYDESSEPRRLTDEEMRAALKLLPKYFRDSEEAIDNLVRTMKVVPKRFYGSTFFTESSLKFINEQFKEYPALMRQIKAEYFVNLLGMDGEVAMKYVEDMDNLKNILARKLDLTNVRFSDINYSMTCTKEDLEKALEDKRHYEDEEDREGDKCLPYGRESSSYLRAKENVASATESCKKISSALELGERIKTMPEIVERLEKAPIKSATEEYQKTQERTIR